MEKVLEEKNEITLVGDEVEYIMELVPAPVQENYSVKVVKGPKSGKWTDRISGMMRIGFLQLCSTM